MFLFIILLSLSIYIKFRYFNNAITPKQQIELTEEQKKEKQEDSICISLDNNKKTHHKHHKFIFSHTRAKSEELKANEELLEFRPRVDSKFIVMPPVRVVQNPPKKSKGK